MTSVFLRDKLFPSIQDLQSAMVVTPTYVILEWIRNHLPYLLNIKAVQFSLPKKSLGKIKECRILSHSQLSCQQKALDRYNQDQKLFHLSLTPYPKFQKAFREVRLIFLNCTSCHLRLFFIEKISAACYMEWHCEQYFVCFCHCFLGNYSV